MIYTSVHTVRSNSRTSNCQCSLFSKKSPIFRILWLSGQLAAPINKDKWSCTVYSFLLYPVIYATIWDSILLLLLLLSLLLVLGSMVVVATGVNKCKIKFVPVLAMRADGQWRCSSTHSSPQHQVGWLVRFTPRPVFPGRKNLCYPFDWKFCEFYNPSERFGEDVNKLPLPRIEPRIVGRPTRSLVTTRTELSWLRSW
jgi:hypothetical protein